MTLAVSDGKIQKFLSLEVSGINTIDNTPNAFGFSPLPGALTSTVVTSNEIMISGMSPATRVPAILTGDSTSQLSLDSGATWIPMSTLTMVQNGNKILVRHKTPTSG